MAAGEAGWQARLCAAVCSPPIARLRFEPSRASEELAEVSSRVPVLLVLGFLRTWLNARALLNDFMSGGTDLFSALLVSAALYGCCPTMNGSFLIMFVIWACADIVIFDVLFSFLPNVLNAQRFFSEADASVSIMFMLDNALMLVNCAIQAWMVIRVWAILDKVLPDWRNQFAWGEAGRPPSGGGGAYAPRTMQPPAQQPLLGRPQPARGGGSFSAFQGSGQRLGSS